MRRAHGGPRTTLSGTGGCTSLVAVPVILTLLCAAASAAHNPAAKGGTDSAGTGRVAKSTPPAKTHRKARKHARHGGKTRAATHPTNNAATQPQATQHKSTYPGHQAKRHSHQYLAVRRDPSKLIIPEGDGSPILSIAAHYLGRPYQFGSEGNAFDCSGLVRTVFADMGVELPHSAREIATLGDRVGRDELEPGDLVFFHTSSRRYATHVGIYVGEDKFIHAASRGGQVQVDSLSEAYYAQHYFCARRIET